MLGSRTRSNPARGKVNGVSRGLTPAKGSFPKTRRLSTHPSLGLLALHAAERSKPEAHGTNGRPQETLGNLSRSPPGFP